MVRDRRVRELVRPDEVATPDLGAVDAELSGEDVHQALVHERRDREPDAAVGPLGALVRRHRAAPRPVALDAVGPRDHARRARGLEEMTLRVDAVRAHVADDVGLEAEQPPVRARRRANAYLLVARVAGSQQVLAAILDPLHGPVQVAGQPRHDDLLRVHVRLLAEAAADVGAAHPAGLERKLEQLRERGPHPVGRLGGRPDADAASFRDGEHPARLDRRGAVARVHEDALDDHGGLGEGSLDVSPFDPVVEDGVRRVLVQARRVVGQRSPRVGQRLARLDLELDLLDRVLRQIARVRDDDGDRLADEANDLGGEQRPRRAVRIGVGERRQERAQRELPAGHRRVDALERPCRLRIEVHDLAVRHRASQERHLERPGQADVVDELPAAGQEPPILDPRQRLPDQRHRTRVIAPASALGRADVR